MAPFQPHVSTQCVKDTVPDMAVGLKPQLLIVSLSRFYHYSSSALAVTGNDRKKVKVNSRCAGIPLHNGACCPAMSPLERSPAWQSFILTGKNSQLTTNTMVNYCTSVVPMLHEQPICIQFFHHYSDCRLPHL